MAYTSKDPAYQIKSSQAVTPNQKVGKSFEEIQADYDKKWKGNTQKTYDNVFENLTPDPEPSLWDKTKDIASDIWETVTDNSLIKSIKDDFGYGESYEKSSKEYESIFSDRNIIDFDYTDNNPKIKHFNKQLLEERFIQEADKIIPEDQKQYREQLLRRTIDRKTIGGGGADIGTKDDDMMARFSEMLVRDLTFDDATSERLSALVDKYLEVETAAETILKSQKQRERLLQNDDEKINPYLNKLIGAGLKGSVGDLTTTILGLEPETTNQVNNFLYNAGVVLTDLNPFGDMKDYKFRDLDYVTWDNAKTQLDKISAMRISSMPEKTPEDIQKKEQATAEHQAAIQDPRNTGDGYWKSIGLSAAELLGSMTAPTGEFSLLMKGASGMLKGAKAVGKGARNASVYMLENKMTKVANIMRSKPKEVIDLTKKVQENPGLVNMGKLLVDGMKGKDIAYEGIIIPAMKSVMGSATENAARMTIAAALKNSMDLGMDEEEAWEATLNGGMLFAGNEFFGRAIGRMTRGMKLFNGVASKYATNPTGLAKSVENWYWGASVAGQMISQHAVNYKNDMPMFKDGKFNQEYWGEQAINLLFGWREMHAGFKGAKLNRKYNVDINNERLFTQEQVTEDNIGTIRADDKFFFKTVKSEDGEMVQPYYARPNNTPASYVTREAKSRNLNIEDLKLNDVFAMTQEQHNLRDKKTQSFVNRIMELAGDTPVKLQDIGEYNKGVYRPSENAVYLNDNTKAAGSGYEDVYRLVKEEGLHKVTVDRFDKDPVLADKVTKLLDKVREVTEYGTENFAMHTDPETEALLSYHLENPHEFLALLVNDRLVKPKEYMFSRLNSADPMKGIRGILRRTLTKDKGQEKEFDDLLNEVLYSKAPENSQNNDIASVGEFQNGNSIETMPDRLPDDIPLPLDENRDIDLDFRGDYGSPLKDIAQPDVDKNSFDLKSKIEQHNQALIEQGINVAPKTITDFMNYARYEFGGEFTAKELNDFISSKTENLPKFKLEIEKIEDSLNKMIVEAKDDKYEAPISDKINVKDIFKAHDAGLVLSKYAGKDFGYIRNDVFKELSKDPGNYNEKEIELISDYVGNQLSRTKAYQTLALIDGKLMPNSLNEFDNKNLDYYDGVATGYNQWKDNFTNNALSKEYFTSTTKELISDLFSNDLRAIVYGSRTIKDENTETKVSDYLEKILSNEDEYANFIEHNLKQGYYAVPRGTKNLSMLRSRKLIEIASNPKKALRAAQDLHKANFYHWLDSDATWKYQSNRPDFTEFAKMIKHSELHKWAKGDSKKLEDLAVLPEYVDILNKNVELMNVLRNKAKEYYTDAEGKFLTLDHLIDENKALLSLDDEITSTFMWGLDAAGDGRTIKFSADRSEARVKKLATKYEGVQYGRNAKQLASESLIRKHIEGYNKDNNLNDSELKSMYDEIGIKYHNGELFQRTIVVDPNMLNETMSKIFTENGTDGATMLTNDKIGKLYNSMMMNDQNSAVVKPKYYGIDDNGNILIYKTGGFNLQFDKFTEQGNSLVNTYVKNISKSVGAITFNTSMKSGHTRKIARVPSSLNPDGYVVVNALKQPIGAEVNGKADSDLYKAEIELYKENLNNGIIEDKYIVDIPLTGNNPMQLIGASHEANARDAGSFGVSDNPLHNSLFELWQSDEGKAFGITQKYIENIIDSNVDIMEGLISLRNNINETLTTTDPARLRQQAKALKAMSEELLHTTNADETYDFVSNIGVENFRSIIDSAIDSKGELKKEYILPLLAIDRFITGQAGTAAGTSSLLFNASKRAFANASKVRGTGTKATVIPDMQSVSDISRLINYEMEKTNNTSIKEHIKSKGVENIAEVIDPETGLYKAYSQGISLSKDVIEKLGLKMGDRIFAKLTPNDDLHSIVPLYLTGMTSSQGTVAFNKEYMTEVLGRDFDKDDLQIMTSGKDLTKEDFDYLWNFYTKEGMHTGRYKKGNQDIKDASNKLVNNQRVINEKFAYEKKATLPQETGFGKTARQSHIGQGKGIGVRNIIAKALKNVEWQQSNDGNHYATFGENRLKYPSDPKLANEISELVQKAFDTYDYAPYDKDYELLKLFVDRIVIPIDEDLKQTYDFASIPKGLKKQATEQAFFLLHRLSNNKINEFEKSKNLNPLNSPKLKLGNGQSTSTILTNRILNSKIDINNQAEVLRDKVIEQQSNDIRSKATEYKEIYPEVYSSLNAISSELQSRTASFLQAIPSTKDNRLSFAFKSFNSFGKDNKKGYLKAAQGVLYNDMANKFRHSSQSQIIANIGGKDVSYKFNGIEGTIEYNNQSVPLKELFNTEGVLKIPELENDPNLLNDRIVDLVKFKAYTDSEKGNLLGRMAGVVTKRVLKTLNKKGYDISEGEAVSILGFSEGAKKTSFLLPSINGSNALPGRRVMEISNVEKGIRDTGIVPVLDGLSPQVYAFNKTYEQSKALYTGKNEEVASVQEFGMPIITNKINKLSAPSFKKYESNSIANIKGRKEEEYPLILKSNKIFHDSLLKKLGFIPNKVSNEMKKIIGQVYNDYTKTIFPESTVKEILYHGTSHEFDSFDKSKLGITTGAASAKKGFFFSQNYETSKAYTSKERITKEIEIPYEIKVAESWLDISGETLDHDFEPMKYNRVRFKYLENKTNWKNGRVSLEYFGSDSSNNYYGGESMSYESFKEKFKHEPALLDDIKEEINNAKMETKYQPETYRTTKNPNFNNIKSVLLDIRNPFIYKYQGSYRDVSYNDQIIKAKELGHDGVILLNTYDPTFTNVYVAFEPEQIHILGEKNDLERFNDYVDNTNSELGSPIISSDKGQKIKDKQTRGIKQQIAKHLGINLKDLNLNKLSDQDWNNTIDKILKPMLEDSVNKSKQFVSQEQRDRFIEEEIMALSAGSIDNTLETLIARDKNAIGQESFHRKDANNDFIISDSQKFVRRTMKSQYLVDYMQLLNDLKKNPSKTGYVNYKMLNSNTKEVIINENSLNKKIYNFSDKLFPRYAYINGALETIKDELTGQQVSNMRHTVVGDLVDKKLAGNQTHKAFSKYWTEYIIPTKAQVLNTDMLNAFLDDADINVFKAEDNIPEIDRLSTLRTKEYIPVLDNILSRVQFNRKFDIIHKEGKIIYRRESIDEVNKGDVSGSIEDLSDIMKAIEEDFFLGYRSNDETETISDRINMFSREIAPQLDRYIKSKMIFKHSSDYLRNLRDNAEFMANNRITDPAAREMLNQEVEKVNDMINRLEKGSFDDVRTLTRKFKISDEEVLMRMEDYFIRPREATDEKYKGLLDELRPAFQESMGAAGNLKTTFQRALEQGRDISPEQALETMIINEVGMPIESISERLQRTMPDKDHIRLATDMKELVRMANNEKGDWYNIYRKLNYEGYEKEWKDLDPYERKEISDKTVNKMWDILNNWKASLKTTAKVKAYFGEQTPSLKTKEFTDLEDLFAVTIRDSENRDMFNYSMKNFQEKMEKIARHTSYAIQKAANIEYTKDPEPNKVLEPIILSEFTSAMGSKFQYNQSYDIAALGNLASMTSKNQATGIRAGKPLFAMFKGRDGETKQIVGRYLNTFNKAIYDPKGNVKTTVPYITFVDDVSMNSRIYTMPISSLSNMVTGEATQTLMRKHDARQEKYYEKLSKTILPELNLMTDQFITDEGNIERSPNIDKAEDMISTKLSNTQEDLNRTTLPQFRDNVYSTMTKARVASTYGYAGIVSKGVIGMGLAIYNPIAFAMAGGVLAADIIHKTFKGYVGNKTGVSAGAAAIGYSDKTNPFARGLDINKDAIITAWKAEGTPVNNIASAATKALDATRDNQTVFGYLVGQMKEKEAQKNPYKDWIYNKQTQSNKQALELIENHIRNKYKETEADIELVRAGDKLMNKIISKVEKNGSTVSIRSNNVFIDGKSIKEFNKFEYKLIDLVMDWSMAKGKFAEWEKKSYTNAIITGEANLKKMQDYFRKYNETNSSPIDPGLVFNALLLHKVNSIGDYDKTPAQRSNKGKLLSLYSAYGKESFLNSTVYRADREKRFKIAQEIYADDKEFQDWYKKKNGVPFLDMSVRSGKQDFIEDALIKGLAGLIIAFTADAIDISDILDNELGYTMDYGKRQGMDLLLRLSGVQTAIMDATQLAISSAVSLVAEPTSNTKAAKKPIMAGNKLASDFLGGGVQNEIISAVWEIGALTAYSAYANDKGYKYRNAIENTVEDRALDKIATITSYAPFVNKQIVKDIMKPKKK